MIGVEDKFDFLVIGAGMFGSAAARHLAEGGAKVALVGPEEPEDKTSHAGVFASHYDQARITRRLDSRLEWSRFASESIKRYANIEETGGCSFFFPVGSLMAGPENGAGSDFIQNTARIGSQEGIDFDAFREEELRKRFPYFEFPESILALYEPTKAGWINPRLHVAAEIKSAERLGAVLHKTSVERLEENGDHVIATCADNSQITASKAIIACGAFSRTERLLPQPVPLNVYARTVVFFEIDGSEAKRLKDMPSVVYLPPDLSCDPYVLPPVTYPDGKTYVKIGGDPENVELETKEDINDWFRSDGDKSVGEFLADQLIKLMPSLRYLSISTGSCVTSFTKNRKPLIYPQTERLIVLAGGNGAGAKCADEVGRLGASVALSGKLLVNSGSV